MSELIPIFAAVSPSGMIVKSSISTFRIHAQRYAVQRKNFSVVKLADINAEIKPVAAPVPVVEVPTQEVSSVVEIPEFKPKRKYTRRAKNENVA